MAGLFEQHRHGTDGRDGIDHVLARVFRGAAAHGLEHAGPTRVRVEVAAGRDSHAALNHGTQVRDDVAEHVRRDDHVVVLGILDHPHAASIDVVVVRFDVAVLFRHVLERTPPQVMAIGQDVRLGHQSQTLAFGIVALAREVEGPTNAAFATFASVDRRLDGDFVGRVLLQEPARSGIEILRILTDDDEIDVLRPFAGQWRFDAGIELHRTQVDVLVQLESHLQQQASLQDSRRHVGMADGSQIDRVESTQFVNGALRQDLSCCQIAFTAEVIILRFVLEALGLGNRVQHLDGFSGHFRPGSVTADNGDLQLVVCVCHRFLSP